MISLVGLSMLSLALELVHIDLEPLAGLYDSPAATQHAAQGSTISAIVLTLILVGMMHRRFAHSEASLSVEKAKSERLLRAILPDEIADELRETGQTKAVRHEDVSILFTDIVGFTPLALSMSADDVVAMLAEVFKRFDGLIEECGVEKIKTIGDAYGCWWAPVSVPDHAERITRCALVCSMSSNLSVKNLVTIYNYASVYIEVPRSRVSLVQQSLPMTCGASR